MQNDTDSADNSTPTNRFHDKAKLSRRGKPSLSRTTPIRDGAAGTRTRPKPMRQFDYATDHDGTTASSEKIRRIFYWVVPPLAFLGLLAIGIGVAFHLWLEDVSVADANQEIRVSQTFVDLPIEEDPVLPQVNRLSSSLVDDPIKLREAYLDTFGGIEALQNIRSMKTTGTLVTDGRLLNFQAIKKIPDMGAFSVESKGNRKGRYIMNGRTAWEVIQDSAGKSSRALTDLQRDVVALASQLFDPLTEVALGLGGRIESVEETNRDGRICFLVKIEQADGAMVKCLLDRGSLRLILEERNVLRDGRPMKKAIRYNDYKDSPGGVRAHRICLFYDGELQSEMVVDSIRINTGVMSSLFRVPSDLKI